MSSKQDGSRNVAAELLVDLADHVASLLVEVGKLPEAEAHFIANEAAVKIADNWGGQAIYIPMDQVARLCSRNAEIYDAFTGDNVSELVSKFGLSRQAIYRIIRSERLRRAPVQPSLMDHF